GHAEAGAVDVPDAMTTPAMRIGVGSNDAGNLRADPVHQRLWQPLACLAIGRSGELPSRGGRQMPHLVAGTIAVQDLLKQQCERGWRIKLAFSPLELQFDTDAGDPISADGLPKILFEQTDNVGDTGHSVASSLRVSVA